ncbi:MAG: class I SAM-dependent methyltransferase [Ginsengibacter sp.]
MGFSSNDLYTSGEYFSKKPTWDDEDTAWKAGIIQQLIMSNHISLNEVVEVGCGAGGVLQHLSLLFPSAKSWKGYDISNDAIALAQKKTSNKITFYNEDFANLKITGQTDLLLCIDVVEHIDDYYGFLQKLKGRSAHYIFHIPLDLSCRTLLKPHVMLEQRNTVGHLHYFSKEIIEWALKDTGFTVIDWLYTKPVIDFRPKKNLKAKIKKVLRNMSFSINKNMSAKLWGGYSMMILAK